jgi:hypothetical protein
LTALLTPTITNAMNRKNTTGPTVTAPISGMFSASMLKWRWM